MAHTGIMIALMLGQQDANNLALKDFDGALPAQELHITLFMMGDISDPDMTLDKKNLLDVALKAWAANHWPVAVKVAGIGIFQGDSDGAGNALVLPIDSVQLDEMRDDLEEIFESLGISFSEYHSFNPHVTLAYLPASSLAIPSGINIPSSYVFFPEITLAWGDWHSAYAFGSYDDFDQYATGPVMPTTKAQNFGAKVGQNIAGRLIRGAGGKFASSGAAPDKTAGSADKPAAPAKKPSKTDEAKAAAKQAIADARAADKETAAQDKADKFAQNVGDTLDSIGASSDIAEVLAAGDPPGDLTDINDVGKKALADAGLGKEYPDGTFDLTPAGRHLVSAAGKGDAKAAKRTLATAQAVQNKKNAAAAKKGKKTKKEFDVQTSPLGTTFKTYAQADGQTRWVAFSSSAFKDKDGHYVTLKSLADDVEYADSHKDYGTLNWWHEDGAVIGTCDYNAIQGAILIESGIITNQNMAQALAKTKKQYGLSIGFKNFVFEPDEANSFNYIRRFERSILPAEKASNWFTKLFTVNKKEGNMKPEKFQELVTLLDGNIEAAQAIVQGAETTTKDAKEAGATFKEVQSAPVADAPADGTTVYVAEMSQDELNTHIATQVKSGLQPVLDAITGLGAQTTEKETSAVSDLTTLVSGLAAQVTALTETVKGLTGESTKAFRASQSGSNIVPEALAQTVKQVAPAPDPVDSFMHDLKIV